MFKKILIPLDGSELSHQALPTAIALVSGLAESEIILLRVPDYTDLPIKPLAELPTVKGIVAHKFAQCHDYLNDIRQQRMAHDIQCRPLVIGGDPASVIVDTAIAEQVDLIVMSTHGHSGITRWMLGSVTEKVLQVATCPVLTVRSTHVPRNILIALDGSIIAGQSMKPGLKVAERLNAQVTLLRVVDSFDELSDETRAQLSAENDSYPQHFLNIMHKEAKTYLTGIATQYHQEGVPDILLATTTGRPADCILDYAEKHDVDLIVVTTHGYSSSARWQYGSVTEKVRRSAKCALLIIRPSA